MNEDEVVLDEVRTKPADVKLSGEKAFERHISTTTFSPISIGLFMYYPHMCCLWLWVAIWESYLGPNLAALKGKAADVKTKDKKGKGKKGKSKK